MQRWEWMRWSAGEHDRRLAAPFCSFLAHNLPLTETSRGEILDALSEVVTATESPCFRYKRAACRSVTVSTDLGPIILRSSVCVSVSEIDVLRASPPCPPPTCDVLCCTRDPW
jgi:hypothetical protein